MVSCKDLALDKWIIYLTQPYILKVYLVKKEIMEKTSFQFYIEKIKKTKLLGVRRVLNMLCFDFSLNDGNIIYLHAQCLIRIFSKEGKLIICSKDIETKSTNYRKKPFRRYDWTKIGTTLFDDSLKENEKNLYPASITDIQNNNNDITITLDNGIYMEMFVSHSIYNDYNYCEDYILFDKDKKFEHYSFP